MENKSVLFTPAMMGALVSGDFENAAIAATPGGIEAQEEEGQRRMASSFRTLPKDMDRAPAELFGFVFGDDEDDIFVNVTAPEGWVIAPTDHSMWSDIVDASGLKRGGIFYKAAFYDRRAGGSWSTRYQIDREEGERYSAKACFAKDIVTGAELFRQDVPEGGETDYSVYSIAEKAVENWLAEHFPDHRNPMAYW